MLADTWAFAAGGYDSSLPPSLRNVRIPPTPSSPFVFWHGKLTFIVPHEMVSVFFQVLYHSSMLTRTDVSQDKGLKRTVCCGLRLGGLSPHRTGREKETTI
ncbi:hypothetical protein CEXT_495371 [Caerostris extrusa]|uniref:Uncharacterized protein n=1 Tax=Caerostris extrusa TaxID=172846 RepID=A0AAV4T029_CAEEX|nr:hypothetical protein CEXT_495371 [Caerostris extrusa]